jgi:hypothetical protein
MHVRHTLTSYFHRLTPFKYLLEGFLALLVTGQEIRCETNEMAIFPPPPGQDCQTYAGQFAQQAGGYVEAQPDGNCGFCQYATGDAFAASFNVFPQYIWHHVGIHLLQFCSRLLLHLAVLGRPTPDQVLLQPSRAQTKEGDEEEAAEQRRSLRQSKKYYSAQCAATWLGAVKMQVPENS